MINRSNTLILLFCFLFRVPLFSEASKKADTLPGKQEQAKTAKKDSVDSLQLHEHITLKRDSKADSQAIQSANETLDTIQLYLRRLTKPVGKDRKQ
jgi:hypothetical protein